MSVVLIWKLRPRQMPFKQRYRKLHVENYLFRTFSRFKNMSRVEISCYLYIFLLSNMYSHTVQTYVYVSFRSIIIFWYSCKGLHRRLGDQKRHTELSLGRVALFLVIKVVKMYFVGKTTVFLSYHIILRKSDLIISHFIQPLKAVNALQ